MSILRWISSLAVALWLSMQPARAGVMERWVYCAQNLWVDKNIDHLEEILRRAAKAGYTHVLLTDSKFAKLGDMDAHYFRNVERVKKLAAELRLEIVPALFPIGYSNDLLWHDPNLIEALPVREALCVVRNGAARLQPDPPEVLKGGDFSDLKQWDWKDPNMVADNGAVRVTDPKGANARIEQKVALHPFRQYHLSVRVKTLDFRGTPEVKLLAGNLALNYNSLGVKGTQDWTVHHVVFNSLDHAEANLYLGSWGASTGSLWWDDARLEEVGLLNVVRRDGAPLIVKREAGPPLEEGKAFEPVRDPRMGVKPWKGAYDVYHEPPLINTSLPDGTRLRVSYYHAVTVQEDQAMICPSEPRTLDLLRDQARRMHAAWGASQRRQLRAGAMLADNVRSCIQILREVNPGGNIYVWSDMFDPHHNAHKDYYLVRGDLAGSWEGLARDVIIVPWYFEMRGPSLKFFAERGHRQLIAGYYDAQPGQLRDWLSAARPFQGVIGYMYTTWQNKYEDLERFAEIGAEVERAASN